MTTSPAGYLFTLATLAISFVGFSALVIVLRQALGGAMSKLDVLLARIFIQLGFLVAAGAILPPMLALFPWPERVVWRISSLCVSMPTLLFAVTYPARRRAASGARTPPRVWLDVFVLILAAAALVANGTGAVGAPGAALFAASLTGILCLSGSAYLQALNILLRQHWRRVTHER